MVLKAVSYTQCCMEQSWRLSHDRQKIWFSPSAFTTVCKKQREDEPLAIRNWTLYSHHNQIFTINRSISHGYSSTGQYLLSITDYMLTFQGLLNALFSVVAAAVTCPGVPCQVHKCRFLCLASLHGKDVSAVSYFAFLRSCAIFTPLLASQGEVWNEECRKLQDCQTKIMQRNSWLKKSLQSFTIHKYLDECHQMLVIVPVWRQKRSFIMLFSLEH